MTLLVPERMLVFSPALAATIGLEEAVLLHLLHDLSVTRCATQQLQPAQAPWFVVAVEALEQLLPFWTTADLQRVAGNLAAQGIIQIDPTPLNGNAPLRFCLHSARAADKTATAAVPLHDFEPANTVSTNTTFREPQPRPDTRLPLRSTPLPTSLSSRAALLGSDWQPQSDTLQLLALKNIPRQFALEQLEDFVFYWRERGKAEYAWDNKFRKHVIERWQHHLQTAAASIAPEEPAGNTLDSIWYPSVDALQILERTGISREFIEDTIPEFVLYWRERGDNNSTWNSKFIAHIRRQWARYSNALEHDQEPRPIAANWQPSEDVYDILRMATIDIQFACELLPEFILFWRDAGTPQRSWNTKFLQHIKYQWATRHHLTGAARAGYSLATGTAAAVANSAFERLTDRSWATGLVDGV